LELKAEIGADNRSFGFGEFEGLEKSHMVVLDEIGDDKSGALRIKKELLWRHRQRNGQEHWQNGGLV
jgi:hypothetical protein